MAGGDYQGQRNSIGSYGFALANLAQGLDLALTRNWLDPEEAKAEFRSNVRTLIAIRDRKRKAADLRAQADDLEGEEDFDV
jgi:hypothetical protein